MSQYAGRTIREARAAFFAENGMPPHGGYCAARWVPLRFMKLRLPNFEWRKRAIPFHDLHHIVTGYECTAAGEMQMAAWEFAAGRFPHPLATMFCLPLVALGALALPGRTFAAFCRGRRSTTLYCRAVTDELLDARLETLRRSMLPATQPAACLRERIAYGLLVCASIALVSSPVVVAAALYLGWSALSH